GHWIGMGLARLNESAARVGCTCDRIMLNPGKAAPIRYGGRYRGNREPAGAPAAPGRRAAMDHSPVPRVFVGVDRSIPGLAALRFAVAEARRRGTDLHAVRVVSVLTLTETSEIDAAFEEALGGMPADVVVHRELLIGSVAETLARRAHNPDD